MKTLLLVSLMSMTCIFLPSDEVKKVTWKNFQGDAIEDTYGISSRTYYFEAGKLRKLEYRNLEGDLILNQDLLSFYPAEFRYSYDSLGNYIRREAFNRFGELMDLDGYFDSSILRFIYNSKNQIIERQTLDKDGLLLEMGDSRIAIKKYEYDEMGRLATIVNFDAEGIVLPGTVNYSYRQDGNLDKTIVLDPSGEVESKIEFEYDDQGFLIGYEQIYPEENEIYTLRFFYQDSVITELDIHSKKGNDHKRNRRGVHLMLNGWVMMDSLLLDARFKHHGEGEFLLKIGPDGRAEDLEPIDIKAPPEFVQEVYELFKTVNFKRIEQVERPDSIGKMKISVIRPFPTFEFFEFLRNPKPYD